MIQLTTTIGRSAGIPVMMATAGRHSTPAPTSPKSREAMRKHLMDRLYKWIPFSLACELHERLCAGDFSQQTRRLLREALLLAREKTSTHA